MAQQSYYQQLAPIVKSFVEHYLTDFTNHDKKHLNGYTGELFFGMRNTGTDLFRSDILEKALRDLIQEKKTDHFTSMGLSKLLGGRLKIENMFGPCALLMDRNKRYFHGINGKITELTPGKFEVLLRKKVDQLNQLALQLKGSRFVYEYELEVYNQEEARRKELNQPSTWQFSQAQPS